MSRTDEIQPPRLTIEGGIERSPCALADPQYADVMVTVREVEFDGLKGATPSELEPAWKPFEGVESPVAVLCEIRDAAATILRNKGYLDVAQVPTQRISDGKVTLEVLCGQISAVRARGETADAKKKLQQYLGRFRTAISLIATKPSAICFWLATCPAMMSTRSLSQPVTSLALFGEVTVRRQKAAFDIAIQSFGAEATGPYGAQLRRQFFGISGMGDATSLSYFTSQDFSEQQVLQVAHEFRPGRDGLTVSGQFTYAWTAPDLGTATAVGVPQADLQAETLFAGL